MKTDTGFCCSINAINLAENYIVPEDNKDGANTNYNGCPYYTSDSYYSTTPSYSYYGTSRKRRKRSYSSDQTTTGPFIYSTVGYWYYETTSSSYYWCNSYDYTPDDDNSVIQR